ncbi:transposase [Paraliobacillus sp. JSM ZJ581]|uniref:transposase n=1 Tax=Paraliobacillus sp. JSM ZJ581 TaxID=3342118 RepID=UPI0035A9632D
MQNNFIIEMLGIKDKHIDSWDMRSELDAFYIELITAVKKQTCSTKSYSQSCDTSLVQIVVINLSKSFKHAVRHALGDPLINADRLHFMRQVYWALDEVGVKCNEH